MCALGQDPSFPVKGRIYPLDGNPEVGVEVLGINEEDLIVDAALVVRLPTGSKFIQVQFFNLGDGTYSNVCFQCTYRDEHGVVVSRAYYLCQDEDDVLSIFDGEWTLSDEIVHKFVDGDSSSERYW
jgi:hypothetical protein